MSSSLLCSYALMVAQHRQNQALAEYAYEREELLSRVDALSREILALRAQMVSRRYVDLKRAVSAVAWARSRC